MKCSVACLEKSLQMNKPDFISRNNAVRSWSRRVIKSVRNRPDVQVLQLQRKVELLESVTEISTQPRFWTTEFIEALTPHQGKDVDLKRMGSEFDGGYVLPFDLLKTCCGVLSIGVGNNNDVDVELADLGLKVHAWDHTVSGLPVEHQNITFHKTGLGNSKTNTSVISLEHMLETTFPGANTDLVLMLDAEGAEWEALLNCGEDQLKRFAVIGIELHDLGDMILDPEPKLSVLKLLNTYFVPVAIHANNHSATWKLPNLELPDAIEVTYIHRDLLSSGTKQGNCSSKLFSPCCPDLDETSISWI